MSDPILFEAFDTGDGSGDGAVILGQMESFGYTGALALGKPRLLNLTTTGAAAITRTGVGQVTLPLAVYGNNRRNAGYARLSPLDSYGNENGIVPNVELGIVTLQYLTTYGTGVLTRFGAGICHLGNLRVRGLQHPNFGGVTLSPLRNRGEDVIHNDRYVAVIQSPGFMAASVGGPQILAYVEDGIVAGEMLGTLLTIGTGDNLQSRDAPATNLTGDNIIAETVSVADIGAVIYELIAASSLTVADDPAAFFNQLLAIADAVFATGAVGTNFQNALLYVAAVAELGDRADLISMLAIADSITGLDAASIQRIGLMLAALDGVIATDVADSTLRLVATVADTASFSESTATSLRSLLEALDTGVFTGRLSVGGTSYSVYALTLLGQAPSEYTHFDFDSYATIGGRLYAVGPQGLVLCEGDSDDGAAINSDVRRGLSTFGTQLKKSMPYAYIGYTSTGSLVLETITTDKKTKRVNRYKLSQIATPAFSDGRFKIAQGLHSVYWDFRLKNLDGADFEVDYVKVWRVPLSRRK